MAFDAARGRTVLFGGTGRRDQPSFYYGDTWEYDGRTWSSCGADAAGPSPRMAASMAYDSRRRRIVMFGGVLVSSYALTSGNDTWEHDGAGWIEGPQPPAALVPRPGAAMAFDEERGRIVLFGGLAKGGGRRVDTWEYDGQEWLPGPAAPKNLAPQLNYSMVTDVESGHAVMFGGYASYVWEYGDGGWSLRPSKASEPSGLPDFGLAYDSWRRRMVVLWPDTTSSRTWESDGSSWRDLQPATPRRDVCGGAQPPSIRGTVTERDGKKLARIAVKLEGAGIGRTQRYAYTDEDGAYCFDTVPAGKYDVLVIAPHRYQLAERDGLGVEPGKTVVADFSLCPDDVLNWFAPARCGALFDVAEGCPPPQAADVAARVRSILVDNAASIDAAEATLRLRALGPDAVAEVESLLPALPAFSLDTAVRFLGSACARSSARSLATLLDRDPVTQGITVQDTQLVVLQALARVGGASEVPSVERLLTDVKAPRIVRRAALEALAGIGTAAAIELIDRYLPSTSTQPWYRPPCAPGMAPAAGSASAPCFERPTWRSGAEQQREIAIVHGNDGRRMVVFHDAMLGSSKDVWIAELDGNDRPGPALFIGRHELDGVVGFDDSALTATRTRDRLVIKRGASATFLDVDMRPAERDEDHDALPDLVEERLGLDPREADTDGDGVLDGSDGTPNVARDLDAGGAETPELAVLRHIFAFGADEIGDADLAVVISSSKLECPRPTGCTLVLSPQEDDAMHDLGLHRGGVHIDLKAATSTSRVTGDLEPDERAFSLSVGSHGYLAIVKRVGERWFVTWSQLTQISCGVVSD